MRRGLLARAEELAALGERLGRAPFDRMYEALQKRCALLLETAPVTETMWRSAHQQGRWGATTAAVASMQGRIFDLVISHRIERNLAYRDRAVEELKNLLRFSTWADPSHRDLPADLCTGEACATVAVALDWLAEELTDADRLRCQRALREKGLQPYLRAVESGVFWHSCYHNWNAVVNGGVGLAAVLLEDEEPDAPKALQQARAGLVNFFNALGREGGWDEGLGYWGYAMRYVLLLAEALARTAGDNSLYHRRGLDVTGLFPVYFSPHGLPVSFGDRPLTPAWGVFYLLAKHFGVKEVVWWLDRYAHRHDVVTSGYSDAGLGLLFRPLEWADQPAPDLHAVKAFNEIGWVAMADDWPVPGLYAALKTGDMAAHHAQLDMNSVQVMVGGELLLHDLGSPEFSNDYLSPERRYEFYEARSSAHNTLIVGGREHRLDAVGSIVEAQEAPGYRWAAGEAGAALGEDVQFVRHVVMPVAAGRPGGVLVVLDEVRNVLPEEIVVSWHTAGQIRLNRRGESATIVGTAVRLHVACAATCRFQPATASRRVGGRKPDQVLTLTTAPVREAVLVSVFGTRPPGKVRLKRSPRGDVQVQAGGWELDWEASRRYLRLERVRKV